MVALRFGDPLTGTVALKTSFGKWRLGDVIPVRAGLSPVSTLARVGEQSGLEEYARVTGSWLATQTRPFLEVDT